MRTHRSLALVTAVLGTSLLLGGCGDGGPSVRAEPVTTTSEPTTTSSTDPTTTSTTVAPTPVPAGMQMVRFQTLQMLVPEDWPVHDLAAAPTTCVRVDQHAVYLGTPGGSQDCPAHPTGHIETVLVQTTASANQLAVARATVATTVNGIRALVDPDPDANGALTVVLPDLGLVAFITYGASRAPADQILATFSPVAP